MIVILLSWVNIFFLSYTWGRFFITAILEKWFKTSFQSIVLCNFIGLAILNWLVDIFAIYIPINYKFQIALELLSFIIWLLLLKKKKIYLPSTICSKKKIFFLIIFLYAFLATWIRCFFATGHYDEGLYYIQHVRWLQNYGFVNGLANLHTRFGFNSNWHNLSSLFEYSYFSKNYFHNDLNGFLFIIFIATSIKGLYAIFQKNARISHYLSTFFVLPLIYPEANFFTFGSSYVNTISPDWASYIFVSITFILLAESIERYQPTEKISLIVVASLMSIYSFSIKISNIPMILISIFGLFLILTLKLKLKEIFFFICINLLLIIPWIISNIILSGYIIFPIKFLNIPFVDWAVPKIICQNIVQDIKLFAYTGTNTTNKDFYSLLEFWFNRQTNFIKSFYLLFSLIWLFELIFLLLIVCKKSFQRYTLLIIIYLICSIGVLLGLLNAPDYRFSFVYLSGIFVIGITFFAQYLKIYSIFLKYAILIVFLLIFKFEITFNDLRVAFISNLPHTEKVNYETQNGINIITNDDRCFDTPLPCTPYYEYYLKGKVIYRDSSNVRKGFRLVIDNYSSKL